VCRLVAVLLIVVPLYRWVALEQNQ